MRPETGPEVWPWHLDALLTFAAVSGQWRVAQVGGGLGPGRVVWLGLDATAAAAELALAGRTVTPEVWEMVKAIAAGAAEELNG